MPASKTAIVYRVTYRRPNWRPGVVKNKLFNSEAAATKYAASISAPITKETPEKFRNLKPAEVSLSFGVVRWEPLTQSTMPEPEPVEEPKPLAQRVAELDDSMPEGGWAGTEDDAR